MLTIEVIFTAVKVTLVGVKVFIMATIPSNMNVFICNLGS